MKVLPGTCLVALFLVFVEPVTAQQISVSTLPPVVVETSPRAGDQAVDPLLSEVRVTFSKEMSTSNSWSWVIHTKETFPEIAGKVHYVSARTNVLPVRLQPGRTYALWLNSPNGKFKGFRDSTNIPTLPYLLVFQTRK
jgi:hypothetical protein